MASWIPSGTSLQSLRFRLPLFLMLYCGVGGLILYLVANQVQETAFERAFERDELTRATEIQSRLERAAERGELETGQREFGELSVFEEIRAAVFVSPNNEVILSNRREWVGRTLDLSAIGLPSAEHTRIEESLRRARAGGRIETRFSLDRSLLTLIVPAVIPVSTGELTVSRGSLIVLVCDLSLSKQVNSLRLRRQFLVGFFAACVAVLGLGISLHLLVTRRIERLHEAMRRFASGEPPEAEAERPADLVDSRDEISELHKHFDVIATSARHESIVRRKAEEGLRDSEQRFRSAMYHSPIGMALVATSGAYLEVNPALCAIVGYSAEELLATTFSAITHPEDVAADMVVGDALLRREMESSRVVKRYIHKEGHTVWVQVNSSAVFDEQGEARYFVSKIQDITERKRSEEDLYRANRALRTISHCNQALVHATGEVVLLDRVCRVIVREGGYPMAWVGFSAPGGDSAIEIAGIASNGDVDAARLITPQWYKGQTREAIRTGEPVVRHHWHDDDPWHDEAAELGYRSSMALPLRADNIAWGALTIYSGEESAFDQAERTMLRELADDIAYGIVFLRTRATRRQAEQALRESRSKLEMAMDMAGIAHWELDTATDTFMFDERLLAQLGTSSAREGSFSMLRLDYLERFIPIQDVSVIQRALADALSTTEPEFTSQIEHRVRRLDGSIRVLLVRFGIERDESGQVVRLQGANQDITERKQAARDIEAANERYERQEAALTTLTQSWVSAPDDFTRIVHGITEVVADTLSVALVGVWRHDESGTSTRCQDLFALSSALHTEGIVLAEDEWSAFFHALAGADVMVVNDAVGDPRTAEIVATVFAPHGVTSMMCVPIRSRGATVGLLSCKHVGSPRRWMPDEQTFARAVANLLAALIAQAERQRLEQQLRQAQKLEAIGQLAGGVAHDFNNILTVILGRAEEVGFDDRVPADLREAIADISQNAERASGLTRQLLAFSRRQTIEVRDLDLNAVVGNVTRLLHRILGEDIVVATEYSMQAVTVRADPGMLEQVILNLAVNARDAMPFGGRLTIETSVREAGRNEPPARAPGSLVCLRVTDSGVGIPPEHLSHIFEPFFTTKDVGKGTGLGLATTYGIVQQHGGWIEVDSELGHGTEFRVFFPRVSVAPIAALLPATVPPPRGRETILVVEDEAGVRALVMKFLQDLGYRLLQAQSGPAAMEVWREHGDEVDLLLTDIVMPDGMNGVDLAERLRRTHPDLKVIYTSGYLADLSRDDIPRHGADAYLAKPFSLGELARLVRKTLDATPAADSAQAS